MLADDGMQDSISPDIVAGRSRIPESPMPSAMPNRSGVPFARPFIKYTPTWPQIFHADTAEPAKPDRQNEADPGAQADQGQEPSDD